MAVSINRIRRSINEIQKTLGDRIVLYADNAVEITQKAKEIIDMYRDSKIFYLYEDNLSKMEKNSKFINFQIVSYYALMCNKKPNKF
jgi:hypothetical protein